MVFHVVDVAVKVLGPAYMAREEALRHLEVLQSFVVEEDDDRGGARSREHVPMSKRLNNSKKLAVTRTRMAFDVGHLARPVSSWTESIRVVLRENVGDGKLRGVSLQLDREGRVKNGGEGQVN